MVLKVCDRCGCEIKPKNNDPGAIKFGWTRYDGDFTNKTGIEPFDLCSVCMKQLVVFLGCEPKRVGMKDTINEQEKAVIQNEINKALEQVKELQEKHAK
jgi:hypothetical protein